MVFDQIGIISQFVKWKPRLIFQDIVDKLNNVVTVSILMCFSIIVGVRSYFLHPISCYTRNAMSGLNLESFIESFCWVHGTYVIPSGQGLPQTGKQWSNLGNKINYYQWIPIILGIQTVLFMIPIMIWYLIFTKINKNDLEVLKSYNMESKEFQNFLEVFVKIYMKPPYKITLCSSSFNFYLPLLFKYLIIKVLYLINGVCQLMLVEAFLGVHYSIYNFQTYLVKFLKNYSNWNGGVYFPTMTFCYISDIRGISNSHFIMSQCVLPINMFNEKIYLFLWLWLLLISILNVISILFWLIFLMFNCLQRRVIRGYVLAGTSTSQCFKDFVHNFIHLDGLFILIMLDNELGQVQMTNLVMVLWKMFEKKQIVFNNGICHSCVDIENYL